MGLYDSIMGRKGGAAPGAGAATDPLDYAPLPDMTPDLYDELWGTGTPTVTGPQPTGDPAVVGTASPDLPGQAAPVYGADSRGAAMRQEDAGAVGGTAGQIIRAAQQLVGKPYVWGGTSNAGVDCSGLVQLAYKAAGISLPRVSYQQANAGQRVSLGALRPGDLVAWDNSTRNGGADHIAIYIGGGRIIEAPRPGTNVRVRKLGNNEAGAWGVRIIGGKRA